MMSEEIEWVNFYMEFADKLLEYKNNREELIKKVYKSYDELEIQLPTLEADDDGNSIIPKDMDPFTIFGLFNKQIKSENRIRIIKKFKEKFNLNSEVPTDFFGIPLLNNQKASFYYFKNNRGEEDINNLWNLFETSINYSKDPKTYLNKFISSYDKVIAQKGIRWNITMGLFWIRPNEFISLDTKNREFLSISSNLSPKVSSLIKELKYNSPKAEKYLEICNECKLALKEDKFEYENFPELSDYAYENSFIEDKETEGMGDNDIQTSKYWLLSPGTGAKLWEEFYNNEIIAIGWDGTDDLTNYKSKEDIILILQEFYNDDLKHFNDAHALWQFTNEIQIGDIIIAKKGMSEIIGRGIVESDYIFDENRDTYKHVRKVRWTDKGNWHYGDESNKLPMKTLTEITNYKDMVNRINELLGEEIDIDTEEYPVYTIEDFLNEVYITKKDYETLKELLLNKKNLIIQGAPGVGKTFIAKRLAYSIMGLKDIERVMMVQFHQSYSYEDFVMGYRPTKEGFELKYGSFYKFCKKAEEDSENDYFFIIDEINRGNLSKIFGELFMLIENDKRGNKNKIQLLYSDESFFIPKNLHIIGLMNTADRSLAMIDYALRRRFSFFDLEPGFESQGFVDYRANISDNKFDKVISAICELNNEIEEDETLGEGFRIGHSYFCNIEADETDEKLDFIIEYEIIPLLKEYWFDEADKVRMWSENLRNCLRE